jgi:hypothetical protein
MAGNFHFCRSRFTQHGADSKLAVEIFSWYPRGGHPLYPCWHCWDWESVKLEDDFQSEKVRSPTHNAYQNVVFYSAANMFANIARKMIIVREHSHPQSKSKRFFCSAANMFSNIAQKPACCYRHCHQHQPRPSTASKKPLHYHNTTHSPYTRQRLPTSPQPFTPWHVELLAMKPLSLAMKL